MILTCPFCGPRAHDEFAYKGDASARRPAHGAGDADGMRAFVYSRTNPAGPHRELWSHVGGCRTHVLVTRDTTTHEVISCEAVGPFAGNAEVAS